MTKKDITLSRRSLLGGMAGIGLAAGALGTGTYALLSDTETSSNNSISAGTLNLKVNGQNGVSGTVDVGPVGSGSSGTVSATLNNTGSQPGKLGFTLQNIQSSEGLNPESESGDPNNPGELAKYVWVEVGVEQNGVKVPGVGPAPLSVIGGLSRMTGSILRAGSNATMYIDWMAPDLGNDAQGDDVTFDIAVDIEERPVWNADAVVTSGDSIQSAIDAASAGDVIEVRNGTYTEALDVNKPLTILSRNGAEYTKIAPSSGYPVSINASDVTIEGFTLEVAASNQHALIMNGTVSDGVFRCNRFIATSGNASTVASATGGTYTNMEFSQNVFDSEGRRNVYINPNGSNFTFEDNYFGGATGTPMVLESVSGGVIRNNQFLQDASPYWQFTVTESGFTIEDNLIQTSADYAGFEDNGNNYSDATIIADNTFFGGGTSVLNV